MIPRPAPTPDHDRLRAFIGDWIGEETVSASPWSAPGPARGFVSAEADIDGFYVVQDYRQERDGAVTFKAKGLFTFDTQDRQTKFFWFDSLGFVPSAPASGRWEGSTLTLVRGSVRGAARYTYRFEGADLYRLRIEYSPDVEGWSDVVSGVYRRA